MNNRIALVSNDCDFFEYIIPKLNLRKSDEIFRFSFDEIPENLHRLKSSFIIINSEDNKEKTITLLKIIDNIPALVFSFDEDKRFITEGYKAGMLGLFTLLTPQEEFESLIILALKSADNLKKSNFYRDILVNNKMISENNEVFTDYINILEQEFKQIHDNCYESVLIAISPNDKTKFLIQPNQIETIILNNIRKNDILMNFSTNKYFLILNNTNVDSATKIWDKIRNNINEKIFAGITYIGQKSREQAVNEALNKLHESINKDMIDNSAKISNTITNDNFKQFRKDFNKNFEQIVVPVFYQVQQKYSRKLFGVKIEQVIGSGEGLLEMKSKYEQGVFKITSPGLSVINIDITYSNNNSAKKSFPKSKRITLEPTEFESGLLEDLIEQFVIEFNNEVKNDNT